MAGFYSVLLAFILNAFKSTFFYELEPAVYLEEFSYIIFLLSIFLIVRETTIIPTHFHLWKGIKPIFEFLAATYIMETSLYFFWSPMARQFSIILPAKFLTFDAVIKYSSYGIASFLLLAVYAREVLGVTLLIGVVRHLLTYGFGIINKILFNIPARILGTLKGTKQQPKKEKRKVYRKSRRLTRSAERIFERSFIRNSRKYPGQNFKCENESIFGDSEGSSS